MLRHIREVKYILRLCSLPEQMRREDTQQRSSASVPDLRHVRYRRETVPQGERQPPQLTPLSFLSLFSLFSSSLS